jgi:hypothetical protein
MKHSDHPGGGQRASQVLLAAVTASNDDTVTIEQLVAALHERAFGVVLMLVALVNCVPLPPGISSLAGVPVLLIGLQMLLGRERPWLPASVRRRAFKRGDLLRVLLRIQPYLQHLEWVCRPRLLRVFGLMYPHLVGGIVVVLSIYIMAPMMFTNIPPALAAVFLSVALIEEDGLMLMIGALVALIALTISTTLAAGTIAVVLIVAARLFGF